MGERQMGLASIPQRALPFSYKTSIFTRMRYSVKMDVSHIESQKWMKLLRQLLEGAGAFWCT
jgi:hypothetical protein